MGEDIHHGVGDSMSNVQQGISKEQVGVDRNSELRRDKEEREFLPQRHGDSEERVDLIRDYRLELNQQPARGGEEFSRRFTP